MAEQIDLEKMGNGLRALLETIPQGTRADASSLSPGQLKRLMTEITSVIDRLIPLSRELDPIKRPVFIFDPTNPEIVGSLIGRTMMEQPSHPLEDVPRFYGSGVYALFYAGDYDAYGPIKGSDTPIYVGKADPPTPDAKSVEEQGPKLCDRLREHAKSVRSAKSTLEIRDFRCRFLVVQSGWQRAAEDYLHAEFHPIWNSKTCYGFGKHGDSHKTRANTRSPWDTLHPGRPWATRQGNKPNPRTAAQIKNLILDHFAKYPPNGPRS